MHKLTLAVLACALAALLAAGCASRTDVMAGEYEKLVARGIPPDTAREMVLTNEQNTYGSAGHRGGNVYVHDNAAMGNFNAIRAGQRGRW